MSWFFTHIFASFLLPPLNLLLISLAGMLFWSRRPRTARILLTLAFTLLWLLSTPFLAECLIINSLEDSTPALDISRGLNVNSRPAEAIIVLGGGTYFHAPEYTGDTISAATLQRLRYAAKLYQDTRKPILLSGGTPQGQDISEALLMRHVLEKEFNTPVKWIEEKSDNTLTSANYSYPILRDSGIKRIYLVTHAWHMPRSVLAFEAAGFEVIPAPTAFTTRHQTDLLAFTPSANALRDSQIFLHEVIGILWYRLKSST
jgi:uncharacterized SAM-binding protein YcdF (DUF218 family)